MKQQSGFTLIELIMVIVILGILAATAMPKFADLKYDARISALEGLKGAMDSAAAIAHGTQLTKGYASDISVTLAGNTVLMLNGYPASGVGGIMNALDLSGGRYVYDSTTGGIGISGVEATCQVTYTTATSAGAAPVTTIVTTGC